MNLVNEFALSYLEEDNVARAYFRLFPLLTVSGECRQEAMTLWPDFGSLRIVPDKNEQGYFKDRMRSLGSFCLLDVTSFPPTANKIRTNKNYRPEGEEHNQFILYSDAVKALPEHTFFELVEGDPATAAFLAEKAITPLFYILYQDCVYGPVRKAEPTQPKPAPQMEATIYEISCPDGVTRRILCTGPAARAARQEREAAKEARLKPEKAKAPAPAAVSEPAKPEKAEKAEPAEPADPETPKAAPEEKAEEPVKPEEAALPIGQKLVILDENKSTDQMLDELNMPLSNAANPLRREAAEEAETEEPAEEVPQNDGPLTGSPITRAAGLRVTPQRVKNHVQEAVHIKQRQQREHADDSLPDGAVLTGVENPYEKAVAALENAWSIEPLRERLADFILFLPQASRFIVRAKAEASEHQASVEAAQADIDALREEHLRLLVGIDKAKEHFDAFRKEALRTAKRSDTEAIKRLEHQKQMLEEEIAQLQRKKEQAEA